jgi:hypothetical protein
MQIWLLDLPGAHRYPCAEPSKNSASFRSSAFAAGSTASEVTMAAMKTIAAAAVFGLWALPASAADLRAEDAARHVGETATVCGVVASAKFDSELQSQPTFLDFAKPYPDQVFTAVIFGGDRTKFGTPETSLRGKRVCVTGKIHQQHDMPEIVLSDPKQLTQ